MNIDVLNEKKSKKQIKLPKIPVKLYILLICIASIILIISSLKIVKSSKVDTSTIANKIDKISELATIKYNYSSVVTLKDCLKIKDFSIPFTNKAFIVKYDGYINLGVDFKSKSISISPDRKKITITLNQAVVLSNVADMNNLMVYDETYSIFNRYTSQDMIDEIAKEQKNIEKKLINDGYIDKANKEAELLIREVLNEVGFEEVQVTFTKR